MVVLTKPVTLADLQRAGKFAWVYCNTCGRERDVNPRDVGLPLETSVPEASKRHVCSACGGRKITVRPELYPRDVEAMRKSGDLLLLAERVSGPDLFLSTRSEQILPEANPFPR